MSGEYKIVMCERKDIKEFIHRYHYTRHVPSNCNYYFGWIYRGRLVSVAIFGIPANKWREDLIELKRLARVEDNNIILSKFISNCCKILKQRKHDLIVSYADKEQGHKGYIYQACSWKYHGYRKPAVIGIVIDGIKVHGRTCNHRYGTRSLEKLKNTFPNKTIVNWKDQGKYLYWKSLNKKGKKKPKRLNLESNIYPKDRKENAS